jgi:hypothetical protein
MAFSLRRQDIERTRAREGLAGAEAAQNIAHRTRLSKDRRDEERLKAEWRSRAQQSGIEVECHFSRSRERGPLQDRHPGKAEEAVRQSIAENSEREAVIDRRALEATALQHAMGSVQLDQVRMETHRFERERRLIAAGDAVNSPQGAYTTPEMIALECENIGLMRAGRRKASAIGTPHEIRRWANQRQLSSDQAAVAELTLACTDWLTAIEGRAGAAKTTTVGAIREFAEERGYAVRGFAPTTRAVKSLSEAGVSATTFASLLEGQWPDAQTNQIWIVDESSLLPTRQVNWLLHKAREEDVGRIIFVGDQRQHHAIEAGRPIHQMQEAGMLVARLDTIRRQRDPELREAVPHTAKGEIAESLAILGRRGDIREVTDIEQRRQQIARECTVAHQSGERVLVVSPANDERRELNKAIRAELIARGQAAPLGQDHTILVNRCLSGERRAIAYNYEEGNVIRFTSGSKQFAIAKGDYARVEAVDRETNMLTVKIAKRPTLRIQSGQTLRRRSFRRGTKGARARRSHPIPEPRRGALGIANCEFASVRSIDERRLTLRFDNDKELSAARQRLHHIDHGYASTSHSAQVATVDRVIVDIDTDRSREVVNQKQFYVSMSRARSSLTIYTNDRAQLGSSGVAIARSRWLLSIPQLSLIGASPFCQTSTKPSVEAAAYVGDPEPIAEGHQSKRWRSLHWTRCATGSAGASLRTPCSAPRARLGIFARSPKLG